jgi:hypothetical protein
MLIEVCGYDGKPLWIESSKVLGVSAKPPAKCVVSMACGDISEEWYLCDNADRVRRAVDEANSTDKARVSRPVDRLVRPPDSYGEYLLLSEKDKLRLMKQNQTPEAGRSRFSDNHPGYADDGTDLRDFGDQ